MGDYVTVGRHRLYYEKKGQKGEPIILLHGIPMSSFLWRHVQERLADNFQSYALDMLGYGRSDKPAEADYTWRGQAKRVIGVMDALGLQKAVIVGHDQGGGVALIIACDYADRVSKFISVNGCSYDYCLPPVVQLIGSLGMLPDEEIEKFRPFAVAAFSTLLWITLYHKNRFTVHIMNQHMRPWQTLEGFKALTKHCIVPSNEELLALDLSKVRVPTLIVWGLEDLVLPLESAYRLRRDIGGPVRLETIATSGHFVPEEEPDQLADYITNFLLSTTFSA